MRRTRNYRPVSRKSVIEQARGIPYLLVMPDDDTPETTTSETGSQLL